MAIGFALMVSAANERQPATSAHTTQLEASDVPAVEKTAGTFMPLYLQAEPQWENVSYAGGTIGDSGCGLTCAAMATVYLTGQDVTPQDLAAAVGDSCLTDGVNDPEKFAQWIAATYPGYGITATAKLWRLDDALAQVDAGAIAFAGVHNGTLGDAAYKGHVIMIWRHDGSGYWVRDPASATNSARAFTREELEQANLVYFVCMERGNYDDAGH
ncbi:C39 family peptidase [Olsenella sp. Marseille-P4559]|uniref:C39 family peptidase n=1 Tax=Olsenella sp. Marseille-P4559 TaxID=2364795 RepID=UPI0013EF0CCF|nr:C39 family peptidase [Olsenella sp. Marseille-P4559]